MRVYLSFVEPMRRYSPQISVLASPDKQTTRTTRIHALMRSSIYAVQPQALLAVSPSSSETHNSDNETKLGLVRYYAIASLNCIAQLHRPIVSRNAVVQDHRQMHRIGRKSLTLRAIIRVYLPYKKVVGIRNIPLLLMKVEFMLGPIC